MLPQIPQIDLPFQPPSSRPFRKLKISVDPQIQSEWCWAAVAAAINTSFGGPGSLTQCAIASQVTGGECCDNGDSSVCNQPQDLKVVLTFLGFNVECTGAVSVEKLSDQVDKERAIPVRVRWSDGGAHFLLVTGVEDVPNPSTIKDILVSDPIYGSGVCAFEDLQTNFLKNGGVWSNTYLTGN
ncbi:hypothetical protein H3V53_03460 [Paraburkholderia bengalensis]|uniref:Papain-like cysteine protease AvrRpt2 n=1 Tax=Paraburkholderia bengalensis TaxID=2747562 RepID=A0ABU8ILC0_9BURK